MKVEVHDLKHDKWFLEAEPSETIAQVKERNYEEHGLDRGLVQKLIFSGKILKDTDTLESIKYVEGKGFLVCMASKARKPAKPKETTPKAAESSAAPAAPAAAVATTAAPASHSEPSSAPLVPSQEQGFLSGPSALVTGSELQGIVNNIMDMGYSQQQVLLAMRRAFNNPDRAVEYLVTGQIPEQPETAEPSDAEMGEAPSSEAPAGEPATSETGASATPAAGASVAGSEPASGIDRDLFDAADRQAQAEEEGEQVEEEIDFQQLLGLDDAQLDELRAAVRQNPNQLLQILDPIVRSNPALAETLINNLDQFLWYMTTPEDREALGAQVFGDSGIGGASGVPEGAQVISLSEDEAAAVHRLMELGFEWEVAATAYLACDKDEEMSANYLFEHGNDMD